MEIFKIVVLSLSGLLLFYAGTSTLIKPLKSLCLKMYLDNPELKIEAKVDIFNEMRSAGSSIAVSGVFIWLGIFFPQLTIASFAIAIVTFLGYAIGRIVSFNKEGKPNEQLVQGLFSELILGGASAICLISILA